MRVVPAAVLVSSVVPENWKLAASVPEIEKLSDPQVPVVVLLTVPTTA